MKVGLVDVDGHNFPNLALMRLSAYHKKKGHEVEWWLGDLWHYNAVYMSKVFSNSYTKEPFDPVNVDKLIKGGTGYCITLEGGREVFNSDLNTELEPEIEGMKPDYSIYPQYDFAVSMTSRGCPRGCAFCHVGKKEGLKSVKVADVDKFYTGQKVIEVLDPNILACRDRLDLLSQYADTGAWINYNQGLDIRLMCDEVADILNRTKLKDVHFAWDDPNTDLTNKFKTYAEASRKVHNRHGTVYVLTNYNSTIEADLYRIYTLRDLGFDPYVMIYDKPNADKQHRQLQRWVNNIKIFKTVKRFEDYLKS